MTLPELQEKIRRWQRVGPESLKRTLTEAAIIVMNEVQRNHLNGPKMPRGVGSATNATLQMQSGRLQRGIAKDIVVTKNEVRARVGTNVEYAAIHEFGGTIHVASRGQLAVKGKFAKTKRAMGARNKKIATLTLLGAHDIHMPERAFLRPSLAKEHPRIFEMIERDWMAAYGK